MDRQCSSCGGFCKKSGCERENIEPTPDPIYTAPPQVEPEPVAWYDVEHGETETIWSSQRPPWEGDWKPLYTAPPQRERIVFPTMLRKMWSGTEVQAWLDENVNKEKNT